MSNHIEDCRACGQQHANFSEAGDGFESRGVYTAQCPSSGEACDKQRSCSAAHSCVRLTRALAEPQEARHDDA